MLNCTYVTNSIIENIEIYVHTVHNDTKLLFEIKNQIKEKNATVSQKKKKKKKKIDATHKVGITYLHCFSSDARLAKLIFGVSELTVFTVVQPAYYFVAT